MFSPQLILQKDFLVIYALAQVCGQDRTLLASILLRIFRHEKAEASLLRTFNDKEISMEGKSFTSLYMSLYTVDKSVFRKPKLHYHMTVMICFR